jgi:hypothetical protein
VTQYSHVQMSRIFTTLICFVEFLELKMFCFSPYMYFTLNLISDIKYKISDTKYCMISDIKYYMISDIKYYIISDIKYCMISVIKYYMIWDIIYYMISDIKYYVIRKIFNSLFFITCLYAIIYRKNISINSNPVHKTQHPNTICYYYSFTTLFCRSFDYYQVEQLQIDDTRILSNSEI